MKKVLSILLVAVLMASMAVSIPLTASAFSADNYKANITKISIGAPITGENGKKYLPATVYFTANEDLGDSNAVYFLEGYLKGMIANGDKFEGISGLGMTLMGPLKPDALEGMGSNAFSWQWSEGYGEGVLKYNIPLKEDGDTQTIEQSLATGQQEVNCVDKDDKISFSIETVMNTDNFPPNVLPEGGSLFSDERTITIEDSSNYPKTIEFGNTCTITVHYVYAEGGQAAPDKNEPCDLYTNYIIPSPKIEGYTPDKSEVNGLASENKEITVTYTKNLPDLSTAVVTGLSSDDTKEYTENEVKNIGLEGLVKGTDYTAAITTDESGTKWIVTMEAVEGKSTGKQTVEVKKAQETVTITVHYVYAEGGTAAPDKNEPCDLYTNYIIPSPKIEGYTPDKSEVNGLASENKEITVTYTKNSVPEPAPVSKDISLDEAKWVGGEGSEALVSLKGTLKGDGWMIGDAYAKIGGAVTSSDCDAIQTGQKGVDTTIKDNGNGTFSFEFKNVLYWLNDKLPTAKSKMTVMMSFWKDGIEYVSNQLTVGMGETAKKAAEAKTSIKVTAAKTKIYVGATTTVKAAVTNGSGTTTFTTSNKAVAAVDKKGKVTGKGAGTATITAVNNGVKKSVKITVIKRTNTVIASVKGLSVKYKTTKVFKNAISVKNAKGKITFKKTSGKSQIKVNKKTGKITVKKGLKKGTYKVKVKITDKGNAKYKGAAKTVKIKITIV